MRFRFIDAERAGLAMPIFRLCRLLHGETHYLWRAVDHEGEVLEVFVTKRRDRRAALKFLKHAMKRSRARHRYAPCAGGHTRDSRIPPRSPANAYHQDDNPNLMCDPMRTSRA